MNLFDEREPDLSSIEKHQKAMETIEKTGLEYYVTLIDYKLKDIAIGARVKTPAKYFKKYEAAKIFQLFSIIEKQTSIESGEYQAGYSYTMYSPEEMQEMKDKLSELSNEFPEYVL
jgi:hypothetical protein